MVIQMSKAMTLYEVLKTIVDECDLESVVRCKDCKHFEMLKNQAYGFCHNTMVDELFYPDGFCSYGERGDSDDE